MSQRHEVKNWTLNNTKRTQHAYRTLLSHLKYQKMQHKVKKVLVIQNLVLVSFSVFSKSSTEAYPKAKQNKTKTLESSSLPYNNQTFFPDIHQGCWNPNHWRLVCEVGGRGVLSAIFPSHSNMSPSSRPASHCKCKFRKETLGYIEKIISPVHSRC